jgi:leader peptidase (prepilin peptidase) / N-methyltransferase
VDWLLPGAAAVLGAGLGPFLARASVRLAARDLDARPTGVRVATASVLTAGLLAGAAVLGGARPATAAFAWAAGAAVVLGSVDLLAHRLPDRVAYPAAAVAATALLVDAAVLGGWPDLLRALAAAAVCFGGAFAVALLAPDALGFGDVKLLGLLGLLLGWVGWGVLLAGVFLGLVVGAGVSLVLLATRRAGWHSAVPFGPPLLTGAALALALAGAGPSV